MTSELTKEQFESKLKSIQDSYEKGQSTISDSEFDDLVEQFENRFGVEYTHVGADPTGEKVRLPYYMGSMDKSKGPQAQAKLDRWSKKYPGPYIIADKLDGTSGMQVKNGSERRLYTRGNGTEGTNISHIIPYINLPIPAYDLVVVGEILMNQESFKITGGSNARNVGTGFINSKSAKEEDLRKLHFVAYNIRELSMNGQQFPVGNQSTQFHYLKLLGFEIPWYAQITINEIKVDTLTSYLQQRKQQSIYDLDGLVITDDSREFPHLRDENPDHLLAFKQDSFAESIVTLIEWNASKGGLLKPIVHFETKNVAGANLSKASGKNAKFIVENKLGVGSRVKISRGGDVIPDIVQVLSPGTPQLPNYPEGSYKWNENNVEFVLTNPDDDSNVQKKRILYFIKHMGIENIGPGVMDLIYNAGYTTIKHILNLTVGHLSVIPGLGAKSGMKIIEQIQQAINNVPLYKVMVASGTFGEGFGEEKMKAIIDAYPNIFNYYGSPQGTIAQMVRQIGGFDKMSAVFEEKIGIFLTWIHQHPEIKYIMPSVTTEVKTSGGDMNNLVILFTGVTSKQFKPYIENRGGTVKESFSNDVNLVVAVDVSRMTGKAAKAASSGKKIISLDEFKRTYGFP